MIYDIVPGRGANMALMGLGPDPFDNVLNSTIRGGQIISCTYPYDWEWATGGVEKYVTIRSEVILGYELTIQELRRQILHYRLLLAKSQVTATVESGDLPFEPQVSTPMDAGSVRIIDSIVAAVRQGSSYDDAGQGDL